MTILFETLRVALSGLASNKLRSALTMIGITIGVAAVIILVSVGQAVQEYIRNQFLSIGSNLLIVFPMQDENGDLTELTMDEADALSDHFRVPDVSIVMPQVTINLVPLFGIGPESPDAEVTLNIGYEF